MFYSHVWWKCNKIWGFSNISVITRSTMQQNHGFINILLITRPKIQHNERFYLHFAHHTFKNVMQPMVLLQFWTSHVEKCNKASCFIYILELPGSEWSVSVRIPIRKLPIWSSGAPRLRMVHFVKDCNRKSPIWSSGAPRLINKDRNHISHFCFFKGGVLTAKPV